MKHKKFSLKFRFQELFLIVLIVTSSIFLSFSSGGFIVNFRNVGFTIFSTVEDGISKVTLFARDTFDEIKLHFTLKKEYETLVEKLKDYEQMQQSNSSIRKENARLKEQLGFANNIAQKTVPANIISRGADNLHPTIIIDKGSRDGIKKNMSVVSIQHGVVGVVGKIISVGFSTSQIMPIYNIDCSVSARVQNTRDLGLVSGNGSEDVPLSMKYIKRRVLADLHYGDVVVTSGENGNYLKDIPVGTISSISIIEYDSSLAIEITPMVDFSRLETVIVVSSTELKSEDELKGSEQ